MLPEQRQNGAADAANQGAHLETRIGRTPPSRCHMQAIQNSADLIATSLIARANSPSGMSPLLKMLGCRAEELIGKDFAGILSPENPTSVAEAIGRSGFATGWNGDCILRTPRTSGGFPRLFELGPDRQG